MRLDSYRLIEVPAARTYLGNGDTKTMLTHAIVGFPFSDAKIVATKSFNPLNPLPQGYPYVPHNKTAHDKTGSDLIQASSMLGIAN